MSFIFFFWPCMFFALIPSCVPFTLCASWCCVVNSTSVDPLTTCWMQVYLSSTQTFLPLVLPVRVHKLMTVCVECSFWFNLINTCMFSWLEGDVYRQKTIPIVSCASLNFLSASWKEKVAHSQGGRPQQTDIFIKCTGGFTHYRWLQEFPIICLKCPAL